MQIPFAPSARGTVGVEWELMLANPLTGELVGAGPDVIASVSAHADPHARYSATAELLTNTVEVTSGVSMEVAEAIDDIAAAIAAVREHTGPRGIELMCAGSHPFAQWFDQAITDKSRYHTLIERTQWWGRNMMIWGVHVHVGVDDVRKVMPLIGALSLYLPHLQALSASSPFWAGERTGYASNRALVFQQLPTAGLPWDLSTWDEYEGFMGDMVRTGIMDDATDVKWDIRPAPRWGTIEIRACDGMSTLPELAAVAALAQCLVEHFSRELDAGRALPHLPAWYHRENKWRAARYGLDAHVLIDPAGRERPVTAHLDELLDDLYPIADQLGCRTELEGVRRTLTTGASYQRQIEVANLSGGDLSAVARHLIREFREGPRSGAV